MRFNPPRRSPSGSTPKPQDSPGWGNYQEIFVAPDGSDESNSGLSYDSPVQTLLAALRISARSSVDNVIRMARGQYEPEGLEDPALVTTRQTILGDDFDDLSSDATVSAYNSSGRIITFSPSPGWTVNQWVGKLLQWQSGPSGPFPTALDACALISQNTADTITVTYPPSLVQIPAAGDVMRVVEPAATIIDADAVLGPPGTVGNGNTEPFRIQRNYRELKNLSFVSTSPSTSNIVFDGSFRFDSVACYDFGQICMVGSCYAGTNPGRTGRGLTALGTIRNPETLCMTGDFRMYLVGGRFVTYTGAKATWMGGFLKDGDSSYPHGCLCSIGGQMLTLNQTTAGRMFIDAGTTGSLVCEAGTLNNLSPITHQGSGLFAEVQDKGFMTLGRNPVVTGSGVGLYAATGGQIRLNIDGSTLGSATCGSSVALGRVVRAAAVWAVGASVCGAANIPRDLCNIYRVQ